VPFHEVRTRFLGNIATPVVSASPLKVVEALWGGELPAFDSIEGAGGDEGGQAAPAGDGEPERGQGRRHQGDEHQPRFPW
jgi:hypothetical protein